ncbi:MAG: hypothetical protein IK002_05185 [Treponema sp.]|uniref:hypothetical protein n=1 Tax=Treponema sp. TaxID=166 RepID=UPI00298E6BAD|nr:hypothetical protein [Treponema sp.]MBR5933363.1 hypothetical protein [Treponema sp.]
MRRKSYLIKIVYLLCLPLLFLNCKSEKSKEMTYHVGDLFGEFYYFEWPLETTFFFFEYNGFPCIIIQDIKKSGLFGYNLYLENVLDGRTTKVHLRKGSILQVKSSILDTSCRNLKDQIDNREGYIPRKVKIKAISEDELTVLIFE